MTIESIGRTAPPDGEPPGRRPQPSGTAAYRWAGRSRPIGSTDGPRPEGNATITPGDRLVWFTDGLIERRTRGIGEGLEALRTVATDRAAAALIASLTALGPTATDSSASAMRALVEAIAPDRTSPGA